MNLIDTILKAARAEQIPEGSIGLWTVKKFTFPKEVNYGHISGYHEHRDYIVPAGVYTYLFRLTSATLHKEFGEVVMEDSPMELKKHLDFMLKAKGRVLITGLGLGCVLRGCLENPAVKYCVVIERDADVINLVAPHLKPDRFKIIKADAREWTKRSARKFDCAWHDIWDDEDAGEPHLSLMHCEMITNLADSVKLQGAWIWPRHYRRAYREFAHTI